AGVGGAQTVAIPIINDTLIEDPQNFTFTLSGVTGDAVLGQSSATVEIVSEDIPGTVGLDATAYSVNEADGTVTISVSRAGGVDGPVTVNYSTSDGTAIAGQDYSAVSGQLSWESGVGGAQTVVIPLVNDTLVEVPENFTFTLSGLTGNGTLGQSSAIVTLTSDDNPGTVSLDAAVYSVGEKAGSLTITATRSGGSSNVVSVDFVSEDGSAQAGDDYGSVSGSLTWSDGETGPKSIVVPIVADALKEANESFTLNLNNPSNDLQLGVNSAVVTIIDEFLPGVIGLSDANYSVAEGEQTTLSVIRKDGGDGAVSVAYALVDGSASADKDYVSQSGLLQWADKDTEAKTIVVKTLKDAILNEPNETFTIKLSDASGEATLGANDNATINITEASQALASIPDLTPNELAIARALDEACNAGASGEFVQLCNDVYSSGNAKQILEALIPGQIAAQGIAASEFGSLVMRLVGNRMSDLRRAGRRNPVDVSGFNLNINGKSTPLQQMNQMLYANALKGGGAGDDEEALRDSPLSFFLKGQINVGNRDATTNVKGFDIETKGITLGADYRFNDELVMGMAVGYGYTNNDFAKDQGRMATQSGDISTYGSYFLPKDFYLDWILSYTLNSYDMERRIVYPGFSGAASSNPMGDQYGISVGFGKDIYYENVFFGPYARLEYLNSGVDAYSETATGGVALAVENQTIHSAMSTLGGQVSQSISLPWGVLTPGLRAEWVHQFENDNRAIQARFLGAPIGTGHFAITTDNPDRDYFNFGGSISLTLPEGRAAFFRYETRAWQDRVSYHTLELGVRIPF
ncbi:MAG: Calx-beta domain-containing protein, partial [Methylomonas sp.]|nr:Calx-beta domain-containing protein [Methylomonas sp.]